MTACFRTAASVRKMVSQDTLQLSREIIPMTDTEDVLRNPPPLPSGLRIKKSHSPKVHIPADGDFSMSDYPELAAQARTNSTTACSSSPGLLRPGSAAGGRLSPFHSFDKPHGSLSPLKLPVASRPASPQTMARSHNMSPAQSRHIMPVASMHAQHRWQDGTSSPPPAHVGKLHRSTSPLNSIGSPMSQGPNSPVLSFKRLGASAGAHNLSPSLSPATQIRSSMGQTSSSPQVHNHWSSPSGSVSLLGTRTSNSPNSLIGRSAEMMWKEPTVRREDWRDALEGDIYIFFDSPIQVCSRPQSLYLPHRSVQWIYISHRCFCLQGLERSHFMICLIGLDALRADQVNIPILTLLARISDSPVRA